MGKFSINKTYRTDDKPNLSQLREEAHEELDQLAKHGIAKLSIEEMRKDIELLYRLEEQEDIERMCSTIYFANFALQSLNQIRNDISIDEFVKVYNKIEDALLTKDFEKLGKINQLSETFFFAASLVTDKEPNWEKSLSEKTLSGFRDYLLKEIFNL